MNNGKEPNDQAVAEPTQQATITINERLSTLEYVQLQGKYKKDSIE